MKLPWLIKDNYSFSFRGGFARLNARRRLDQVHIRTLADLMGSTGTRYIETYCVEVEKSKGVIRYRLGALEPTLGVLIFSLAVSYFLAGAELPTALTIGVSVFLCSFAIPTWCFHKYLARAIDRISRL